MKKLLYFYYRLRGFSENQAKYKAEGIYTPTYSYVEYQNPAYWGTHLLAILVILGFFTQSLSDEEGWTHALLNINQDILYLGAAGSYFDQIFPHHHWRLFTYTLLHGGIVHLLFNLMALQSIGPMIEQAFGFSRTVFVWVSSGIGAIVLPALVGHQSPLIIGASGSIFGFIGLAMAYGHLIKTENGRYIRNKMIEWTVTCTLFGWMMGGVAHSAHFGGLVTGWILALLIPPPNTPLKKLISIPLALLAFAFIFYALYSAFQFYEKTI